MRELPGGSDALLRSQSPERNGDPRRTTSAAAFVSARTDPSRQARRLPIRILKMLTAHGGHLLHPEYLQPLTSAPVSIEVSPSHNDALASAPICSCQTTMCGSLSSI